MAKAAQHDIDKARSAVVALTSQQKQSPNDPNVIPADITAHLLPGETPAAALTRQQALLTALVAQA